MMEAAAIRGAVLGVWRLLYSDSVKTESVTGGAAYVVCVALLQLMVCLHSSCC